MTRPLWIGLAVLLLPRIVMENGTVRLTCSVPREAANRRLDYGILNYSASSRDLAGEAAAITWQVLIPHVPCGAGPAYCAVTQSSGRRHLVSTELLVGGCTE